MGVCEMKFLVVIIALLIVYSTNLTSVLQPRKIIDPYLKVMNKVLMDFKIQSANIHLFILLIVFLLIVGLIYSLLSKFFFSVFAFFFAVMVLLFCLTGLHFSTEQSPEIILNQAVKQLFSILFWFLILGPIGAVLYVLVDAIKQSYFSTELTVQANKVEILLDWIPVRLLGFSFALIGHFSSVINYWVSHVYSAAENNENFLYGCFDLACNKEYLAGKNNELMSEYLIKLIYRSLILWLVVVAVLILF